MKTGYLALCTFGGLLAGCANTQTIGPLPTAYDGPPGYVYFDAIRPNYVVSPSPQAIENARTGVWLWPPVDKGRRG